MENTAAKYYHTYFSSEVDHHNSPTNVHVVLIKIKNYWLEDKSLGCEEGFTFQILPLYHAFLPPAKSLYWICTLQLLQAKFYVQMTC